jgi:hypothetical protein
VIRFLPFLLELGLLVYCLIDCAQADTTRVRNLPKTVWVLLIIVIPLVGGIGWLVAGRPARPTGGQGAWPTPRTSGAPDRGRRPAPMGPDDDPDFLRQIRAVDAEHERTLKQWEDDLRERERRLKDPGASGVRPDDARKDGPQDEPPQTPA